MLNVKLKPTEIIFSEYTFVVKVNLDSRFFPSRIFLVAFETETEQKQKHMKWRRILSPSYSCRILVTLYAVRVQKKLVLGN